MKAAILLLLVGLYDVVRSQCPSPFEAVGLECFYTRGITRTWTDGQAYCQSLGGYLAVPYNVAQLHGYLHSKLGRRPVWIGGTDVAHEGYWKSFINGLPINPADFRNGEPNNEGGNQDCLELGRYTEPDLADGNCNSVKSVVCEKDVCPTNARDCPYPFVSLGDECFYVSKYPATWRNARSSCHGMGGDLAVPSVVSSLYQLVGNKNVWIGGTDMETEGTWLYVDGSGVDMSNWSNNEPNSYGGDEDCLEFMPARNPPLNDRDCESTKRFVCEVPQICG